MYEPIAGPEDQRLLKTHSDRLVTRDIDQLLGICEFALQDGHIDQGEAESILTWLKTHGSCLDRWPANILFDRLATMLADQHLDDDEQRDLLGLVMSIAQPRRNDGTMVATTLPINDPPPSIVLPERSFCFTGVFEFGTRAQCHEATAIRGGISAGGVTKKLNYLVIGNVGSEVWKHTSFGLKIAKAVDYRDAGVPLIIVSEKHWASHMV